jgi:uncharacterized protein YidB (DUF937 family)
MISSLLDQLSPELISEMTQKFGLDKSKAAEAVDTTKDSLVESLTKEVSGGNFDGILGMLNQGSGLTQNPMFKSLLGNLSGSFASRLGISPEIALSIASFVLPKIIAAVSNSKDGNMDKTDLIKMLGQSSGKAIADKASDLLKGGLGGLFK